ncbi:sigma 54-interacting transcriptional regulator, partial [Thermodesulfobacteriota bacterium]
LLLNEIGELTLSLQAKLLTFLDTKSFLRVGGTRPVNISARLIAATHRNLETEVADGRFLEALFYRINVFMIRVPPLRERQEDLELIVKDLLRGLETELQLGHVPEIDSSALTALARYSWPGNVRELRNVLERSLMLSEDGRLVLEIPEGKESVPDYGIRVSLKSGKTLQDSLDEVTRFLLMEALQKSEGNAKQAAGLLGISRDSIYRHFRRLGLNRETRTQFKG